MRALFSLVIRLKPLVIKNATRWGPLPRCRKREIVARIYADCSNTKKRLFLELGSKCPLFQGLQTLSVHFTALFRVSEVATINDLEFPTLIDESEDGNSFVVDCDAVGGGEQKRVLDRGCVLYNPQRRDGVERDKRG